MSIKAISLVWERSAAKGSNFLTLLGIADYAKDDGRAAFPSPVLLAEKSRLTVRAAELILRKLVSDGEIVPEWNPADERLYYHIRCIYDWPVYRAEHPGQKEGSEKISRKIKRSFAEKLCRLATVAAHARADFCRETANSDAVPLVIRQEPSIEPSEEPLGASAASFDADGASEVEQSFAQLWNDSTTDPILPCLHLTATRRRHIRKRLTERPLTEWVDVFQRINASAFCRGDNDRGWLADFAWVIGSPDVAVKVLEGKYDNRAGRERPFTATELAEAKRILTHAWGSCRHEPRCATSSVCVGHIIRQWRRDRGEAA